MEYTKGAWQVIYNVPIVAVFNDEHEQEGIIARIETTIDDAQLIAAAPDMYEAMKLWQEHQKGTKGHYCYICNEAINKALAKAEGKTL